MFFFDHMINPGLENIVYTQVHFIEDGITKVRHLFETPAGSVDSIVGHNPDDNLFSSSPITHFVEQPEDWAVINYIFRSMLDEIRPNYDEMLLDQEDLGDGGYTIAVVDRTPFQRAWIELASMERTALDFRFKPDGLLKFLDIQHRFHEAAAEITAGCPSDHVLIIDNITSIISPDYYESYCLPYYEMYARAFEGTGKALAVHFDGLFAHLKNQISDSPFDIIDSFTVPPVGNVALREVRELWPDKTPFINLPPHLAHAGVDELHEGYAGIIEEWGSKILTIEHVEDLPPEQLELHLSAVLDVCGF
jgi:hypothetical protein